MGRTWDHRPSGGARACEERGARLTVGLLLAALCLIACEELPLEEQAWRCTQHSDCLWGRTCVDGTCRPGSFPSPDVATGDAGADVPLPESCDGGVCAPDSRGSEPCGRCGTRERTCGADCAWGEWSACTGEGECEPGTSGDGPCGERCGTQPRFCTDECAWQASGECTGEGECAAAAEESRACERCGEQRRVCLDTCGWGPWGLCEGQGVCEQGDDEEEDCGSCGTRTRSCDAACAWAAWSACAGEGECAPESEALEPCGDCGVRSRVCSERCTWPAWGTCRDEGECAAEAAQSEPCGRCGTRSRVCTSGCAWDEWGACEGEGVCAPPDTQTVPCPECGSRSRTCSEACAWSPWSGCAESAASVCGESESCTTTGVCKGGRIDVPQATIQMGADPGVGDSDEQPEHSVAVPAFFIDRMEVTCGEFALFLDEAGNLSDEAIEYFDEDDPDAPLERVAGTWTPRAVCRRTADGAPDQSCADHPVFEVSWYGARDYCAWMGGRLPSEAEWERVASGSDDRLFPWGSGGPGPSLANCSESTCADGFLAAAPVGGFPAGASSLGVADLAGNVWEWVADQYHPNYVGAPTDGRAWVSVVPPEQPQLVVTRGGGWTSAVGDLRASARNAVAPSSTPSQPIGFRCAYDR